MDNLREYELYSELGRKLYMRSYNTKCEKLTFMHMNENEIVTCLAEYNNKPSCYLLFEYISNNEIQEILLKDDDVILLGKYVKDFDIEKLTLPESYIIHRLTTRFCYWDGNISFNKATFSGNDINFEESFFCNRGCLSFEETNFGDGTLSFQGTFFSKDYLTFSDAVIGNGKTNFKNVYFDNCNASFERTNFGNGNVIFTNVNFGKGDISFMKSCFGDGIICFNHTCYSSGYINFTGTKFGVGRITFERATFVEGDVDFSAVDFGSGEVCFYDTDFGNTSVSFSEARFGDGDVFFEHAILNGGNITFKEANFGNGNVNFSKATFTDCNIRFDETAFGNGNVEFANTSFDISRLSFYKTNFGTGEVRFEHTVFQENELSFIEVCADVLCVLYVKLPLETFLGFNSVNNLYINCINRSLLWISGDIKKISFLNSTNLGYIKCDWDKCNIKKAIESSHNLVGTSKRLSEDVYNQAAKDFHLLKENYRKTGQYEWEDLAYRGYMKYKTKSMKWLSKNIIKKPLTWLFGFISGYGTTVWRILLACPVIMLLFGLCYISAFKGQFDMPFWTSMYFSAITFLTIGYGDISPIEYNFTVIQKILTGTEGFIGLLLMSIVTVVIVRKIIR